MPQPAPAPPVFGKLRPPEDFGGKTLEGPTTLAVANIYPKDETEDEAAKPQGRHPFQAGLKAAENQLFTSVPQAIEAATGRMTPEKAADYAARQQAAAAEQERLLPGGPLGITDIRSFGDIGRFVVENVGVSAPQMAAGLVGGAAAGTLVEPGGGTVLGGLVGAGEAAGLLGGTAAMTPLFVGSNVERATEGGTKDLSQSGALRSIAVAPAQSAAEYVGEKFLPGISKVLPGAKIAFKGGLGTRILKGSVLGAIEQPLSEVPQQVAERYAAGLPLGDKEAGSEYVSAAANAAGLGAVIGGVGGPFHGAKDKTQNLPEPTPPAPPVSNTEPTQLLLTDQRPNRGLPAPEPKALPPPDTGPIQGQPPGPRGQRQITDARPTVDASGYRDAVASIESAGHGDYAAMGPVVKTGRYAGDQAHGRYGIMGRNISAWAKEAGLGPVTREQFMASPQLQDAIFDHQFGKLVAKHGLDDAASIWLTGRPLAQGGAGAADDLGTTGARYAARVRDFLTKRGISGGAVPTGVMAEAKVGAGAADDDISPEAILQRITDLSKQPHDPVAPVLAQEIAKGGQQASDAIKFQGERIQQAQDALEAGRGSMSDEAIAQAEARIWRSKDTFEAAVLAAEHAAKVRGLEITTEMGPLDTSRIPGPRENPELAALGDKLSAEGATAYANQFSPTAQREQMLAAQQAQVDAETAAREQEKQGRREERQRTRYGDQLEKERMSLLDNLLQQSQTPGEDFDAITREAGHSGRTEVEDAKIRMFEAKQRMDVARGRAAEVQAALPEQDTSLGVKEPKATKAAEPTQPSAKDNAWKRAQEYAQSVGGSRRDWIEHGAASVLGRPGKGFPLGKDQQTWWQAGETFARDELARQQAERGETPAAPAQEEKAAVEPKKQPKTTRGRKAAETSKSQDTKKGTTKKTAGKAAGKSAGGVKTKARTTETQTTRAASAASKSVLGKELAKEGKTHTVEDDARQQLMQRINRSNLKPAEKLELRDQVENPQKTIANLKTMLDNVIGPEEARVTRRGVFSAAAAIPGIARAAGARTSVDSNTAIQQALKSGKLANVIAAIRDTSKNPAHRELARLMSLGGFAPNAKVHVTDYGNAELLTLGETTNTTGDVSLYQSSHPSGSGTTEETILHEALHSWIAARYRTLGTYLPENREKLGTSAQSADKFVDDFNKLWRQFSDGIENKHPDLLLEDENGSIGPDRIGIFEARRSADEMFTRVFTDPKVQEWMRTHDLDGNKIAPKNPNSLWSKFISMVRKLFGLGEAPSHDALSQIMAAGNSVLKAGTFDKPTLAYAQSVQKFNAEAQSQERLFERRAIPPIPGAVKNTFASPEAFARRTITARAGTAAAFTMENLTKKLHLWMTGTEDIANMMVSRGMPSGRRVVELHSNSHALARKFQEALVDMRDAYRNLPAALKGTKQGSVSDFLYDSTRQGKWGFQPSWIDEKVQVDQDMAKRFNEIAAKSPEAAKLIKDVFKHNFDSREQLSRDLDQTIKTEYDGLRDKATTAAQREHIEQQRQRALEYKTRIFDTQKNQPYTPLKREGRWAVVGKSAEYLAAQARGDQKAMDKMKEDGDHYFVDFRDTAAEAEALHSHVVKKYGDKGSYLFERGKVPTGAVHGDEVYIAFSQLKEAVKSEYGGTKAGQRMERLVTDLYLHSLSENSARKAELGRKNVEARDPMTGETLDMMEAFFTRGNATANYIASVHNNAQMQAALTQMQAELEARPNHLRTDDQRMFNEMMYRYIMNLGHQPNRAVDRVVRGVSVWTLLTSPFYYMQNLTQAGLISMPVLASHVGYGEASTQIMRGYADFAKMAWKAGYGTRLDYESFVGENDAETEMVRGLLKRLALRGRLDAGWSGELGAAEMNGDGLLPAAWNKVDKFLRIAPQRIEVGNRVATAIAAIRAGTKQNMSEDEAFEFASKLIYDTHGDYSGFNSPTPFTAAGSFGKVAFQFRKFQLIMAGLLGKEFHHAFNGATKEEKAQGRAALFFLGAHMAAIGGIVALPGANLLGTVIGALINTFNDDDDKDYADWHERLKASLGAGGEGANRNWFADLMFKGAPYSLLSMDTSDRLGMGNIASLAPYSDLPEALSSRQKAYEIIGKLALGPSGNVVGKMIDGWGFGMEQGDWTRFVESIMPALPSNVMKAARLKTQGLTNKQGDVLVQPEDVSGLDAFYTALGVGSRSLTNVAERRAAAYDVNQAFDAKAAKVKRDYVRAYEAHDVAAIRSARDAFDALQKARVRDGFSRQPMSTLLKAPQAKAKRERQTLGGVQYSRTTRDFVSQLMYADNPAEALAEAQP